MAKSKRAQKAQAELEQLESANKNLAGSGSDAEHSEDEADQPMRRGAKSAFAAFADVSLAVSVHVCKYLIWRIA